MHITLNLYGNLKKHAPVQKGDAQIEIANGTSIRALLTRLGVPDEGVWMCAINDTVVDDSARLHEGDVLEVFEPVGGGSVMRTFLQNANTAGGDTNRVGGVGRPLLLSHHRTCGSRIRRFGRLQDTDVASVL